MKQGVIRMGVIGAGTMGTILAKRFITSRQIASVAMLDPLRRNAKALARTVSVWYDQYEELIAEAELLVLAIKPQDFRIAVPRLRAAFDSVPNRPANILSIMAGVSLTELAEALGDELSITRMMPSVAAQYGKAMVALAFSDAVNQQQRALMRELGQRLGEVIELAERAFDAFIALSGSGIAFGLQVIHALTMGGVEAGLSADVAERIVLQMLDGATTTLRKAKCAPQQLIRDICSPGGTTIAGIAALERGGLNATLMDAVRATVERSKSL